GGISVGKMEEVFIRFFVRNGVAIHSRAWPGLETHSVKAGESEPPGVLSRDGINPHAEQGMRGGAEKPDNLRVHTDDFGKKLSVRHAREPGFLFRRRQPGQV